MSIITRTHSEPTITQSDFRVIAKPKRDRYIDTLRVAALVRVLIFHTFGGVLLSVLFPSMGVMFALAGSLMASSLDRANRSYRQMYFRRIKRLLIPIWGFAVVMVTLMLKEGWHWTEGQGEQFDWRFGWMWLLPIGMPPASDQRLAEVFPMWYIVTYLWFMLLSPALLWLFRRWPVAMIMLPVVATMLFTAGLFDDDTRTSFVVVRLCSFGACWLLGFAHHDGLIKRIRFGTVLILGSICSGIGIWWAFAYPDPEVGPIVSDIPLSSCLHGLGFTLILLRISINMNWIEKIKPLDWLITAINRRAISIYLWGNVAIDIAIEVVWWKWHGHTLVARFGEVLALLLAVPCVVTLIVLAIGWLEDLAAGKRPEIIPGLKLSSWRAQRAVTTEAT